MSGWREPRGSGRTARREAMNQSPAVVKVVPAVVIIATAMPLLVASSWTPTYIGLNEMHRDPFVRQTIVCLHLPKPIGCLPQYRTVKLTGLTHRP